MRQYPRTKFADENQVATQVSHVLSEVEEFRRARWDGLVMLARTNNQALIDAKAKEFILEAHDIIQSAYTLMDILEREYPGQAWSALPEMIEKNRARGYYGEGK